MNIHYVNKKIENEANKMRDEMIIRGYSNKTIKAYINHFKLYTSYNKDYLQFDINKVKEYLLYLHDEKECSVSYLSTSHKFN